MDGPAFGDVTIAKCAWGAGEVPDVQVRVTNRSAVRSNYNIDIDLLDSSDQRVGGAGRALAEIDPGESVTAPTDASATAQWAEKCRLVKVDRYAN